MHNQEMASRLEEGLKRGEALEFFFNGRPVKSYKGETIATALLSAGHLVSRTIDSNPMGVYCNIGVCHSCVMTVNGTPSVRICNTLVAEGCRVESQHFTKGQMNDS